MTCSHCQAENTGDAQFCRSCGQPLAPPAAASVACRHCQALNQAGTRFCVGCGQLMQSTAANPAAADPAAADSATATAPAGVDEIAMLWTPPPATARRRSWPLIGAVLLLLLLLGAAAAYWTLEREAGPAATSAIALDSTLSADESEVPPQPQPELQPQPEPELAAPEAAPAEEERAAPKPESAPVAGAAPATEQKKPGKAERPAKRSKSVDEETHLPKPRSDSPPKPAVLSPPSVPNWYAGLKAELQRCAAGDNFLSRGICAEAAKFRFCNNGNHWGEVPECMQTPKPPTY